MIKDSIPFRIATNTFVQGLGKLITASTTFLIIVILGRKLGEAGYGDLAKAFALVEIFYMVSDFGFNAIVVREMTKNEKERNLLFGNLLGLRILWGIFWTLLVGAFALFLPYDPSLNQGFSPISKLVVIIFSLSIFFQSLLTSANAIFQLKLRYDQSVLAISVGAITKLLLVFLISQKTASLPFLTAALIFGDAVTVLLSLTLVKRLVGFLKPLFSLFVWRFIFRQALPIGLALVFNLLYFRSDMVILSFFRSSAEVGNYSLAYRFFEATLVVPIFFANSLYPILVSHFREGQRKIKHTLGLATLIMFLSSIIVAILVFGAAPILIRFFFKGEFSQSIVALRILILGLPFFYISAIYMWGLVVIEKQQSLILIYGLAAFLTILLNLAFIPLFGLLAAAVITVLGEGLVLLLNILVVNFYLTKLEKETLKDLK